MCLYIKQISFEKNLLCNTDELALKMAYLLSLLLLVSSIVSIFGQQVDPASIETLLSEVVYDVLGQHADEMAQWAPPPPFDPPAGLMKSFAPGSGVGNREELFVDGIRELQVFHDTPFDRFVHRRFNSTDYLLATRPRSVLLKTLGATSFDHDYFVLSADDPVFHFVTDAMSVVSDVAMFTRSSKHSSVLHVAILTESARSSVVHIYEVIGESGAPVGVIDLGISPTTSPYSVKKISFVQSQHGESLVVLIDSPDEAKIVYQQRGSFELNHYIAVYYPSAVDMETFTIHGHGYIAMANATACDIFKLNEFAKSHIPFDRLFSPAGDLVDLEYFRVGFHHYLAVSGRSGQFLFAHKSGEFSLKQTFVVPSVRRVYSSILPSCRDDVVLFFIKDDDVGIYKYSGHSEEFVPTNAAIPPTFRISPATVAAFSHENRATLLFLNNEDAILVFVVETSLRPVLNPAIAAGQRITQYMKEIQDTLSKQSKQLQTIKLVLRDAVRTSGDQHISAFQSFRGLRPRDGATVHEIRDPILIEWEEDSSLTLEQYKVGTEALELSVRELELMVEDIERIIPDVVRTDQQTIITGSKKFTGDISGSSILAKSVNLQTVAGINVPQLQKEVYRLDKPQQIQGTLSFAKPLTITGNLDVEDTINGIDIGRDVMTTDTEQISHASMLFKNKLVIQGDLHVTGRINDLDIGSEVVTLRGDHNITGRKTFLNGIQADAAATVLLDGVDISDLYARALSKGRDQEISGAMSFDDVVTSDVVLHGFLNGLNVSELAEDIVRVDRPAHITGHTVFLDDIEATSTLTVDGRFNGLRIPDDLFLTDIPQTVNGYKEFTGTVTAHNVIVTGTVDDLDIPGDVVTLTGDEEVSSTLHFTEGISVDGDIVVEGLVDGVDISEVAREALKLNETSEFKHGIFFGPVTITGDLVVGGMINKVNLGDVVNDIVYRDETDVVVTATKNFKRVVADAVRLEDGMINGYNIDVDFMKVDGDQVITGTKTFKKPVTFDTLTIQDGMIGALNITKLYENRISLIIEDEVSEDIEFADEVIIEGNLKVRGRIGGLAIPGDVVLRNSMDPIANKQFTNVVKVDNLVVNGDAYVEGTFGGVNLTQFDQDRISLSKDQEIEGDLWLGQSVVENLDLVGLVNGVDLAEFARNVMSKTKDQEVFAEKVFTGETVVHGPITTQEGVNGVKLGVLNSRAFKLQGENYVTEPLEFDEIAVKNISVLKHVNGINLTHLAEDSLKKAGMQHVTGVNVFEAGFHVDGDIVAETVNDLDLHSSVLLNVPQTITGQFTLQSLDISGDLYVSGLINGLDLSEITPRLVKTDQETILESNVTFIGPVHVWQDIQVSGLVNGLDLKHLSETILMREGDQVILGSKVLRGNVTVRGDVDVGFVNGVDWERFLGDVVRTDIPQTIRSPKTFLSDVEVNSLNTGAAAIGLLNGRRLEEVVEDAVLVDVPATITGPKVFRRTVEVAGDMNAELINGLRLQTDVITLSCSDGSTQVISGEKTFGNLTSYANIDVGGSVNGHNLYDLYKDTLLTEGNQTIFGRKTMKGEVTFLGSVFPDMVNGMKLHEDLVTLDTDQEMEGPLTFNGDVVVGKDLHVHGLINNVDIGQLSSSAVYLHTDDTISGLYHFNSAVSTSDVSVAGSINDLDLKAFDRNVTHFWSDAQHSLDAMNSHSEDNCRMVNYLQDVLSKSYYVLDSFVLHQDFGFPASYIHTRTSKEISLVCMDEDPTQASAVRQHWNATANGFVSTGENLSTVIAKTLVHRTGKWELGIYIGIQEKSSFVELNGVALSITPGFLEASLLVRSPDEVVIATLFPSRGVCQLHRLVGLEGQSPQIQDFGTATVGKGSTSVAVFDIGTSTFLAVSTFSEPPYARGFFKIFARVADDAWQKVQSISLAASSYVRHFLYHDYHYLAVNDIAPVHESKEPKSIQIFRNSGPHPHHFSLFQKIPFDDSKGLETFQFGDLSELHLATWNGTRTRVLRLEGESGFRPVFTLHGRCVTDVKVLTIDGDVYLAVGQHDLMGHERPVTSVLYKGLTQGARYSPRNISHC